MTAAPVVSLDRVMELGVRNTVMVAWPDTRPAVAVTWTAPPASPAVNTPAEETVPSPLLMDQVTLPLSLMG